VVDSRCMEILGMLERAPAIVAGIAAQVPESLVRVRSGPFALVEHVWHLGDLAHLNEIADLLADLMPAHPMIAGLRALAAGGPRSSRAA
jgi:hypothetical protein